MSEATTFDDLVESYFTGTRCPSCRQAITRQGCPCSRARFNIERMGEAQDWYDSLPERAKGTTKQGRPKPAELGLRAATARAVRRAGGYPESEFARETRSQLNDQFGIMPKWHPPTTTRTARADNEPI